MSRLIEHKRTKDIDGFLQSQVATDPFHIYDKTARGSTAEPGGKVLIVPQVSTYLQGGILDPALLI